MNNNIYLDLELFLDPAITDAAALKNELIKQANIWSAEPQSQSKVVAAKSWLTQELPNLYQQAEDARKIKIQNLRNQIADLTTTGELQQFEIDYLKRNFACLSESTILQEITNQQTSVKSPQNYFLSTIKTMTENVPAVIRRQVARMSAPSAQSDRSHSTNGKKFLGIVGLVIVVCVGLYIFSCLPKKIGGGFSSYQRGIGMNINRYANRSYDHSQWKEAEDLPEQVANISEIYGWDKNNFVIRGGRYHNHNDVVAWFYNGNWRLLECNNIFDGKWIHYNKSDQLILFLRNCLRIYEKDSYKDVTEDHYTENHYNNDGSFITFFQTEDNIFQFGIRRSPLGFYQYNNEKITPLSQKDATNIFGNPYFMRAYRKNEAIGIKDNEIFKYNNGKWVKHYSTTHSGRIHDLWVIDENNFVLVGGNITVFRDGKETHPLVTETEKSFQKNDTRAVWGTSMNRFWVMDSQGNIAEFNNGQAGKVVVEGLNKFYHCWISPEGIVFAIFGGKLYRLD
ncbi:MAG: hypothetical protein LBT05_12010 [Planctomycetaceae bacterium]|jgi:hypothetical protein|nr:hypothetical protein [Planctomycetaceae bacterium]